MRPKYRKPPVVEVVAEFSFAPGEAAASQYLTQLRGRLLPNFPHEKATSSFVVIEDKKGPRVETITRVQFWNEDQSAVVQIGENFLAFNQLQPYTGWENFLPRALDMLRTYESAVPSKGLNRVVLRYVDRIEMPFDHADIGQYLRFGPALDIASPPSISAFYVGIELPGDVPGDTLRAELTDAAGTSAETAGVLLTMTCTYDCSEWAVSQSGTAPIEAAVWLQRAHDRIVELFESILTEDARLLFEEIADAPLEKGNL